MKSIIIVDDDLNLLEGMRESIPWEQFNFRWVGEAIDGREGIRVINELHPDIVLTDINMPEMNGLEMITALREQGFDGRFVILSGYSDFEYARQAVRLRVDDYICKPVTLENLKTVLTRVSEQLDQERSMEHEFQKLKDQLEHYKPYVIQEWLKSLLTDSPSPFSRDLPVIREIMSDWNDRDHQIIGLDLSSEQHWKTFEMERNLLRFAVQNVACEIVRTTFSRFDYVELHSLRYAVVLHGERDRPLHRREYDSRRLRDQLSDYLNLTMKIPVRVELGPIVWDWRELAQSFRKLFSPMDDVRIPFAFSELSLKFYRELAQAVRDANEEEARRVIADYVGKLDSGRPPDQQSLRIWGAELWTAFAYSLYDLGVELDQLVPKDKLLDELTADGSRGNWQDRLVGLVEAIIRGTRRIENVKHRKIVDFAIRYIHEHYHEDITLGIIADEIQISKNYLGQIFRNGTGETFNQYLTRVRMEKARQMILEGKHYIYEIALKVGYTNIPYFSSQFKKYIGVNPSDLIKNKT